MIEATTHVIIKTKLWIQFSIDKKYGFENWQRQGHYYDGNLYWIKKKTNDEKCKALQIHIFAQSFQLDLRMVLIEWLIDLYLSTVM